MNTIVKIALVLVVLFGSMPTWAQETISFGENPVSDQKIKTLFTKDKRDGFYGGLSVGYAPIDSKDGLVASARGCFIMDHYFAFGLGGTMFVNGLEDMSTWENGMPQASQRTYLAGGYGGLVIEPIIAPLSPVHISFPMMFGVGAATTFETYYYSDYYSVAQTFTVFEPMAEVEVNFTRFMRLGVYVGYRFTSKLNIEGISSQALNNYSTGVSLKLGMF